MRERVLIKIDEGTKNPFRLGKPPDLGKVIRYSRYLESYYVLHMSENGYNVHQIYLGLRTHKHWRSIFRIWIYYFKVNVPGDEQKGRPTVFDEKVVIVDSLTGISVFSHPRSNSWMVRGLIRFGIYVSSFVLLFPR